MHSFAVQIVRFVDSHQPGWVACEFVDAAGCCHTLIDKVPIFTAEVLDETSRYPKIGTVRCEVLQRWHDADGRELARVSTARPWNVESTEKLTEFTVPAVQLTPALE
jgi:hypothetical protein